MPKKVTFDKNNLARLKMAYTKAVKEGKETFVFEGNELLVTYAKYLIEHLQNVLKA